jgi:hypothetical protein
MTNNDRPTPSTRQARPPIPWLWLGLGAIVTLIGLAVALSALASYLARPPEQTAAIAPTLIRLTAPPIPTPTATVLRPTPTVMATTTPVPTIDVSVPPPEITVGYYASVANTGGVGVTVRNGPSTRNLPVLVAAEGSIVLVLDGPEEADSFRWWQIRLGDGTEGWAAGDFLLPAAAP